MKRGTRMNQNWLRTHDMHLSNGNSCVCKGCAPRLRCQTGGLRLILCCICFSKVHAVEDHHMTDRPNRHPRHFDKVAARNADEGPQKERHITDRITPASNPNRTVPSSNQRLSSEVSGIKIAPNTKNKISKMRQMKIATPKISLLRMLLMH